jgi:hypothetical protein
MPKAVSSLQSVQRLYILDNEAAREERKGTEKFKGLSAEELVDGQ